VQDLETFMVGQPPGRTFISCSRKDGAEFAAWLRGWLDERHLSTWQDIVALEGGRDWWSQIEDALKSKALQHFILVVTLVSSVVLIITRVGSAVVPLLAVLLRTSSHRSLPRSDRSRIGGCRGRRRGPVGSLAAVSTIDFCPAECGAVRP
jgi:hypothetical protein